MVNMGFWAHIARRKSRVITTTTNNGNGNINVLGAILPFWRSVVVAVTLLHLLSSSRWKKPEFAFGIVTLSVIVPEILFPCGHVAIFGCRSLLQSLASLYRLELFRALHRHKPQIGSWNFYAACHFLRDSTWSKTLGLPLELRWYLSYFQDISTSSFGGHIAIFACRSSSKLLSLRHSQVHSCK